MSHCDFRVEYNVPLPPKGDYKRRYPFHLLNRAGMSFIVPCTDDQARQLSNSLTKSIHWASYKTGWRFTMRRVLGGIRIWRI